MNLKLTLLAALALTIFAVPTVAAQKKPNQQLSIAAAPTTVTFGNELKITGKLTGGSARDVSGQNVTLESDAFPYEGRFERVAAGDTNDAGEYSFTLKPGTNARYRAEVKPNTQSPVVTVNVRVKVTMAVSDTTPKKGARVKFSGAVAPAHDGKVARVQRKTSTGWKSIAKAPLVDAGEEISTYSKRVRITRTGRYRVRFSPGDGDHVAGKSRARRITVH